MELEEFEAILKNNADRLVLVDFNASWCGPCIGIKPLVMKLANDYKDQMTLIDVDVDESEDIAMKYSIRSMPTFLFIKKEEIVDTLTSAQPKELERLVKKHAVPPTIPFQGTSGKVEGKSTFATKLGNIFNPLLQLGFDRNKCILAAIENEGRDIDTAVNWLMDNDSKLTQQDLKYAENFGKQHHLSLEAVESKPEAKSIKCAECGKMLRNGDEAMLHSQRTKHSQFEESTEEYVEKILTIAEKEEMQQKIYKKMKEIRKQKEEQREKDERAAERKRRDDAKMTNRMREDQEKNARELHIAQLKQENEEKKLRLKAIRDQISADKNSRIPYFPVEPKKEVKEEKKKHPVLEDELLFKFNFPDGNTKRQAFNAKQSFNEVRKWAINNSDALGEEMEKTLEELELRNRSVIMIQRKKPERFLNYSNYSTLKFIHVTHKGKYDFLYCFCEKKRMN
ncbi:hypothetical protein SNEBB_005796 [Seison nebaliae]|nr:hypothetical protein SNEBB_005796 [Seison nebaliae]